MGPIKRFSMILFRGLFLVTMLVAGVAGWTNQNTALAGNTDPWTVSEVNGKVWVDHDGTGWQALKTGTVIKRGSRVKTGMGGRAVLKRPGDSIASSPNSRFRIPTSDEKGAVAHFVQTLGTLLFKVKSRPDDPFNVRTPYLAAVIKGTTFTVTVDAEGAALHVSSGAVEVTSVLDGVIALTGAGRESPSDLDGLAGAIGAPLKVGSERAYDKPLRVWLPLPADVPSNLVKLYYYMPEGPDQGWRPAEEIEGWWVKDSEVRMTVKGTTYLGFLVRHAAIVQLATR